MADAPTIAAPPELEQELEQARQLAARYRFPFADLRQFILDKDLLSSIPLDLMVRYEFLPMTADNGDLTIAVGDPTNLERLDELETRLGRRLRIQVAAVSQVREALKNTEPSRRVLDEATEDFGIDVLREAANAEEGLSLESLVEDRESNPMIRLVDSILFAGLERRASDIHIESHDNAVVVKTR